MGNEPTGGAAGLVLNVEDFEPARYMRTRILQKAGYSVLEAASAAEALSAVNHVTPAVALIDINLPDGNGVTLCDTVKRLHPQTPVLLISAYPISDEIRQAGLAAGAYGSLGEPVAAEALLRGVSQAIAGENSLAGCAAWVVTDPVGFILDASREGAELLNGTIRGLLARNLLVFFDQDRDSWRVALTRAASGERVVLTGRLRPKERRPLAVTVQIAKADAWDRPALQWRLSRAPAKPGN
jgi:CheY-like chemotaxis protein